MLKAYERYFSAYIYNKIGGSNEYTIYFGISFTRLRMDMAGKNTAQDTYLTLTAHVLLPTVSVYILYYTNDERQLARLYRNLLTPL